jgi:hypothetical protein
MKRLDWIISWENLKRIIDQNFSIIEPVIGPNKASIFFDVASKSIGFRTETHQDGVLKVTPKFLTASISETSSENIWILEATVFEPNLFRPFYEFIVEVLESIQIEGKEPIDSFNRIWSNWKNVFEEKQKLSEEKIVGLCGELLFVERLATEIGTPDAVLSWHDDSKSEHDFSLENHVDIEVKTTTAEKRVHLISSINQLNPKVDRVLYVYSVQLTRASSIDKDSFSLIDLINRVRAKIFRSDQIERFDRILLESGFNMQDVCELEQRYLSRSVNVLVEVNDSFPRLSEDELFSALGDKFARISDIQFRINLTGLGVNEDSISICGRG